jgi:hypothetical protein
MSLYTSRFGVTAVYCCNNLNEFAERFDIFHLASLPEHILRKDADVISFAVVGVE